MASFGGDEVDGLDATIVVAVGASVLLASESDDGSVRWHQFAAYRRQFDKVVAVDVAVEVAAAAPDVEQVAALAA